MILADIWARFVGVGLLLSEAELGSRAEVFCGKVLGNELGPGGGRDHGGVVGRKGERRKGDGQAAPIGFGLKAAAKFAVGGDPAGDDDAVGTEGFGGGEGLTLQVADDGVLEGGDEVEGLLIAQVGRIFWCDARIGGECCAAGFDARAEVMGFDVAQDRRS